MKNNYYVLILSIFLYFLTPQNSSSQEINELKKNTEQKINELSSNTIKKINDLKIITEIYPPYNLRGTDGLTGISVDLMELMLKKVGSNQTRKDIKLWPWARGYSTVLEDKSAVLFSTTRTEKREKLFKWVGPISPTRISLFAKKSSKIKINSFEDIKKYKIGVAIEDIGEQLLVTGGIKLDDLDRTGGINVIYKTIKKLNADRIDIASYEESAIKWEIKAKGFRPDDYETVYVLKESYVYYVFHKDAPDSIVNAFQGALDELKKDGTYQEVLNKYLK